MWPSGGPRWPWPHFSASDPSQWLKHADCGGRSGLKHSTTFWSFLTCTSLQTLCFRHFWFSQPSVTGEVWPSVKCQAASTSGALAATLPQAMARSGQFGQSLFGTSLRCCCWDGFCGSSSVRGTHPSRSRDCVHMNPVGSGIAGIEHLLPPALCRPSTCDCSGTSGASYGGVTPVTGNPLGVLYDRIKEAEIQMETSTQRLQLTDNVIVPHPVTLELYRKMLTVFYIEERMKAFVRQGKCGFQASTRGHEKLQIGMTMLLKPCHDWFFTYYRSKGDEVVYVSSGEGATSEGEFFEALNWASREKLPVLFTVQNNDYAISVPQICQTGSEVHRIAQGFGMPALRLDGTWFEHLYEELPPVIEAMRHGAGPALVEAMVVRLDPHSSSDDQRKYRGETELQAITDRDPILQTERY